MELTRKTIISTKVLELLKSATAPLSISQLMTQLADLGLHPNKTTLYRLMDKLVTYRKVALITLNNGKSYFELIKNRHHHHFFCNTCSELFCLKQCHVDMFNINLDQLLPTKEFKITTHEFTLYGICEPCRKR
tara:strand:+ start:88 stop:486 length:399 start_codon:yes stop_codon:yes gene_type:complete